MMTPKAKNDAIRRLRRMRGQMDGILRMVESDTYCGDVLVQLLAVEGAVRGVLATILESHLRTCGEKYLSTPRRRDRERFIREIVEVVQRIK